jgi:hypothetical protein
MNRYPSSRIRARSCSESLDKLVESTNGAPAAFIASGVTDMPA